MGTRGDSDGLADQASDLAARPTGGRWQMGVLGIGAAALLATAGIWGAAVGKTYLLLTDGLSPIYGEPAFYYSLGYLCIGTFLHFHYFWGHTAVPYVSQAGKVLSCLGIIATFSWGFILRILF